jgi:CheY-like chemotaxis protein/HPt (histidine-containing phosphotransfer) domain-containing protein
MPQSARILLAEDHDINRELVTRMLERCGQRVATAHDGNEAISMVIDAVMRGQPFDLALMDVQMPGCDGYAATRAIRGEGIGPDTLPIIALTANAFPEDIADAREAGMQAHLAKPVEFAALARALQRWLPTRIVEHAPQSLDPEDYPASRAGDDPPGNTGAAGGLQGDRAPAAATLTPDLRRRWEQRRDEALHAVREALADGTIANAVPGDEAIVPLVRKLHRLAGTAAIFGASTLGDRASTLERALQGDFAGEAREHIARELLEDDGEDEAEGEPIEANSRPG